MVGADRPTRGGDAAGAVRHLVTELLDRDLLVVRLAQIAGVVVDVETTKRQRPNVVDHVGRPGKPFGEAVLAQPVGPLQPPKPLSDAGATAKPFARRQRHQALAVPSCFTRSSTNASAPAGLLKPSSASLAACFPLSAVPIAVLSGP